MEESLVQLYSIAKRFLELSADDTAQVSYMVREVFPVCISQGVTMRLVPVLITRARHAAGKDPPSRLYRR